MAAKVRPENSYSNDMLACKLDNFTRGDPEAKNYRKIMTIGKGGCPLSGKSPLLFVQCRVTSLEPVCTKKSKPVQWVSFIHLCMHIYVYMQQY